jgi:hypothetical protein
VEPIYGKRGREMTIDIIKIEERIQRVKKAAEDLRELSQEMPALYRNTARILASIKMLEINISDVVGAVGVEGFGFIGKDTEDSK